MRTRTLMAACAAALILGVAADAQVPVQGYQRQTGTYVAPHYRTYPDGAVQNNWSTYPNINPYTGEQGTKRDSSVWPYAGGAGALGWGGYSLRKRLLKTPRL